MHTKFSSRKTCAKNLRPIFVEDAVLDHLRSVRHQREHGSRERRKQGDAHPRRGGELQRLDHGHVDHHPPDLLGPEQLLEVVEHRCRQALGELADVGAVSVGGHAIREGDHVDPGRGPRSGLVSSTFHGPDDPGMVQVRVHEVDLDAVIGEPVGQLHEGHDMALRRERQH